MVTRKFIIKEREDGSLKIYAVDNGEVISIEPNTANSIIVKSIK